MDNAQQWSVFDAEFTYVRREAHPAANRPSNYMLLLEDGTRLVSQPAFSVTTHHVALLNADSSVRRLLVPKVAGVEPAQLQRLLAYSGGENFWVGPTYGPSFKYELEQWSLDGTLLRTIRRSASWFTEQSAAEPPGPKVPYPSEVVGLHVDADGLLYVAIRVNDARYAFPGDDPRAAFARRSELFDIRYEVIDPVRGIVLASGRLDDVDALPMPMIPGTRLGRRMVEDSTADVRVELVEWRLHDRSPDVR